MYLRNVSHSSLNKTTPHVVANFSSMMYFWKQLKLRKWKKVPNLRHTKKNPSNYFDTEKKTGSTTRTVFPHIQ